MGELRWDAIESGSGREYSALLDRAFSLQAPSSYLADFPIWDPSLAVGDKRYQVGGWQGNRLVATASLRCAEYVFEDATKATFGLIGAVASDPEFRGKGYGSEALERVLREGRRRGVRSFALWGSESPIYAERGFRFGGVQLRTPLRKLTVQGKTLHGFEVRNGWDDVIAERLSARKTGVTYDSDDRAWLSKHRGVEWRTLWLDGECLAYCGWNRGIDLPNIVHELEGAPEGVRSLLTFIAGRYPDLELLHHPRHAALGLRALASTESLAQFLFEDTASGLADRVDTVWFSGMDSC
jgi:GNAT superfamily N-acetyltransferase